MKVAISCDYLLERNHYTEVIESVCEIFPEAKIYCLAHKKGAILGHIEQRSIASTFLSKLVENEEDFFKHSNKIPALAKNLFISCEYDLIINISRGFSQGLAKCKKTKLLIYLYDFDLDKKVKKTLLQKLFFPFLENWAKRALKKSHLLILSREELRKKLTGLLTPSEIIPPPFRISDYALFPKTMFPHNFFLIEAKGLSLLDADLLIGWMKEWNYLFQFIGVDFHLEDLKKKNPENLFFGNRCSGEHAPVMASAKAFISFNKDDFPKMAMGVLATGRPVILTEAQSKWMHGVGVSFVGNFSKDALLQALEKIPTEDQISEQKLRATALQYHDIKFKAHIKRVTESFQYM